MSNFHPLEVVDRGSETQLQVGEKLTQQNKSVSANLTTYLKLVAMTER